jgi:hypothetical protein
MRTIILSTWKNNVQLIGDEYSTTIANATPKKIKQSQNLLNTKLQKLVQTNKDLIDGWILKIEAI